MDPQPKRWTWLLGTLVALASWPVRSVVPAALGDNNWQTALHFAAEHRLHFGTEVVFTYGPLGFAEVPLIAYDVPAVLSALYMVFVQLALGLTLVWAARRSFPPVLAFAIALVVASLMSFLLVPADAIVAVAFIWCVVALEDDPPEFSWPLVVFGGGIVAAVEVLGKLNSGLLILAMCAVAIAALQRRRSSGLALLTAAFCAALVALWFAAGQALSNVDDYARMGFEVVSGYSRARVIDAGLVAWDGLASAAIVAAAFAAGFVATARMARGRRAATLLILGLFSFALFKQAFVSHFPAFMQLFVSAMLAPWLAFRWRGRQRIAAIAAIAAISLVFFPVSQGGLSGLTEALNPLGRSRDGIDQLRALLVPGVRARERERARQELRSRYRLDPASRAALGGRSTAIYPAEFSIAWAYGLDFKPLPVLGDYTTYAAALDRRNSDALASDSGPERILRHARFYAAVFYPPYSGPATARAMLCHFDALRTTARYQVLGRVGDRCGRPRTIGSRTTRFGREVEVPRPPRRGEVVFARVAGLEPSGVELARTLLYRAAPRSILLDGDPVYRIYPDAGYDLILSARRGVDLPHPYGLAPNPRTVGFTRGQGLGLGGDRLRIDFYALPVRSRR